MWDPSIIFHGGRYHAFMMYNREGSDGLAAGHCLLASSPDGVHWGDEEIVVEEQERQQGCHFFKCFVGRCGERFIMDHGVARPDRQDTLRFYESWDLRHWTFLANTNPDPRWYVPTGRWDHMYILPKEERRPSAGFWGYPVAISRSDLSRGVGMTQSTDGRSWETLPPAPVEWGDIPQNDFEWGGCERIGGKYYLIGGTGPYLANAGYSMFAFAADDPRGPFRPDAETFRLCGSSGSDVSWLAAWCRGDRELLVSNYISMQPGSRAPSLLPLRKPVVDGSGHLRLGWWPGNERLKGEPIPLGLSSLELQHARGINRFRIAWLEKTFNFATGVILVGSIRAQTFESRHLPPAAGFSLSEGRSTSRVLLLGVGTVGEREACVGRLEEPDGAAFAFSVDDVTGKGCATVTGLEDGEEHAFRLLVRGSAFELYIDDLLVQTHVFRPAGGRIGFVGRNVDLAVGDLRAWQMSLPAGSEPPVAGGGQE
jgi:hypothetical protein